MWFLIILVLCAAVALFLAFRKKKSQELPVDVYVCDVCGERECLCHKQEKS